jgi:hypothetical protein
MLVLFAIAILPAPAVADPPTDWQRQPRVLLAFAPAADDPRLLAQRAAFGALGDDAASRELVLVEVVDATVSPSTAGDARVLRTRHAIDADAFRVLLVGKDGGVKLDSDAPIERCTLLAAIDAMPMRRRESPVAARPSGC